MYSVELIRVGAADVRGPEAFWMERWDEWVHLVFYVVLIRSADRTILLNTGPPDDLTAINRVWQGYQADPRAALVVAPDERLPTALEKRGVSAADVELVVLSPLSAYATGGLHHFPSAALAMSKHGWAHFMTTGTQNATAERETRIPPEHLARLVTDWWPRVRLLEDDDTIAPGVTSFRTGVHDRGSLAVAVETQRGTVVYTDSAYYNENIERRHPIGLAYDLDEAYASYDRIAAAADVVLAGFDPDHLNRYPGGIVA